MTTIITVEAHCPKGKVVVASLRSLEEVYEDVPLLDTESGIFTLCGGQGLLIREENAEDYR